MWSLFITNRNLNNQYDVCRVIKKKKGRRRKVKAYEKKRREGEEPFYGLVIKIIRNNDASIVHRKGTREPPQGNKAENFQPVFRSLSLSVYLRCNAFFFFANDHENVDEKS